MRIWVSASLLVAGGVAMAAAFLVRPAAYHPVTPAMLASAKEMAGRQITAQRVEGSDGLFHSLAAEASHRPLVLVFIQDGCPCSEAAERYFHRLHAAYGTRATFFGVIDGDRAVAKDWAQRHRVPYLVLADAEHRLIEAYGVERSASVALVDRGGTIDSLWPGYSAEMLADLGARLSRHTGLDRITIDTEGAPVAMAAGCRF